MWTRAATAAELRALTRVVWPIVVTQLSQMGMGVADTMMAGRVSAADLAGVTLGGNLYWPSMLLLSGIVMSITPSVSQLHGGGRTGESGEVVRQALWIALVGGAVTTWLLHNAEPVYHLIGVDPVAIPIAAAYLAALSTGLLPLLGYMALRNLCDGLSWTLPAMCIGLSGLVLKVPLNALFIYGNESLGIAPMGGVGCGWATALVMFYQLAAMTTVVAFSRVRMARLFARFSWPDRREILRLVRLGVPIGITMFVEVGFFSVVGLSIGALGVVQVASHQIAFNVAGIAFMVPLALSVGATIRVGTNIGAGQIDAARLAGAVAMGVVGAWSLVSAALILSLRQGVSELFSSDPAVIQVASALMVLGALFQFFDGAQVGAIGTLRGYKDTRAPAAIGVVAYWCIGLPVGAALCYGMGSLPELGVSGYWWGVVIGLGIAATLLLIRLYRLSADSDRIAAFSTR
ncbi:MAG: MATE family efflux transporter [Gammaproteobacteria bacterium]|nr:MATE family efflux transporter [Gammaproteobacteria bacterium]